LEKYAVNIDPLLHKKPTAFSDIQKGLASWRIWYLLGISDIRQRYSRSKLGQFWVTLSTAVFIGAIGVVNGVLFNQDIHHFLPFVAANIITWNLISGIITDSCGTFIQSENYIRQIQLPRTAFIMRVLTKNVVNFLHNLAILPVIYLIFPQPLNFSYFLAPIGFALILVAGFLTAMILGVVCTRFRDLSQIVSNTVQLAFFVTPILWPASALRSHLVNLGTLNPFAAFLNVLSEPLRGIQPAAESYIMAGAVITLLAVIALPLFAKYRSRIPYWL
jgi:lipopolysaccharide transport system permease protein